MITLIHLPDVAVRGASSLVRLPIGEGRLRAMRGSIPCPNIHPRGTATSCKLMLVRMPFGAVCVGAYPDGVHPVRNTAQRGRGIVPSFAHRPAYRWSSCPDLNPCGKRSRLLAMRPTSVGRAPASALERRLAVCGGERRFKSAPGSSSWAAAAACGSHGLRKSAPSPPAMFGKLDGLSTGRFGAPEGEGSNPSPNTTLRVACSSHPAREAQRLSGQCLVHGTVGGSTPPSGTSSTQVDDTHVREAQRLSPGGAGEAYDLPASAHREVGGSIPPSDSPLSTLSVGNAHAHFEVRASAGRYARVAQMVEHRRWVGSCNLIRGLSGARTKPQSRPYVGGRRFESFPGHFTANTEGVTHA